MTLQIPDSLTTVIISAVVTAVLGFFFGHKHGVYSANNNSDEEKK